MVLHTGLPESLTGISTGHGELQGVLAQHLYKPISIKPNILQDYHRTSIPNVFQTIGSGAHAASDFPPGSLQSLHLLKPNDWQPSEEQTWPMLKNRAFSEKPILLWSPHTSNVFLPPLLCQEHLYEVVN